MKVLYTNKVYSKNALHLLDIFLNGINNKSEDSEIKKKEEKTLSLPLG